MQMLFSRDELRLMQQLKQVALTATNRVPRADVGSPTAIIDRVLSRFGFLGDLGSDVVRATFRGIFETGQARQATRFLTEPLQRAPNALPGGIGGTVGGVTGAQIGGRE